MAKSVVRVQEVRQVLQYWILKLLRHNMYIYYFWQLARMKCNFPETKFWNQCQIGQVNKQFLGNKIRWVLFPGSSCLYQTETNGNNLCYHFLIFFFFIKVCHHVICFALLINLCFSGSSHIMATKTSMKPSFLHHYLLDECCSAFIFCYYTDKFVIFLSAFTHYGNYNENHLLHH